MGPGLLEKSVTCRAIKKVNRSPAQRKSLQSHSTEQIRKARGCASRALEPLLRVLLATGLSRRQLIDVCERNLQRLSGPAMPARFRSLPHFEPLEHIIARWATHPAYLDVGKPMRLRLKGKRPSFQSLVRSVVPSSSASFVLRALKRRRLVRVDRNGRAVLLSRFHPARVDGAVDIETITKMAIDFLRTYELNLLKNPPMGHGLFQRYAQMLNSDARLAPTFNKYVREQGQLFLETIDEWLVRHQPKKSSARPKKRVRLGVGIYIINEALR